jgi:GDP-L-fucose synthase
MREEYLLTGPLETTNEAYALAKIAAIRLCKHYNQEYGTNYISAMPTNMYGQGDNYDLENGHVLPVLIRKFHEAKVGGTEVTLWGDGSPLREFLYSDDLGAACVFLMNRCDYKDIGDFVNVGSGSELTVKELAAMIADIVGYEGSVIWDRTRPNGTPRKLMDSSRFFSFGWKPKMGLREGIGIAYQDFLKIAR